MTDVAAAVIAASAALAGSTLSGVFGWVNARSIAARADRREVEIANRATKAEARAIASNLADDIRALIETVRRDDPRSIRYDFREQFLDAWFERDELTLRRWADRLPVPDLRQQILLVLECVDDGYVFDRQWLASYELYVNQVLTLAYDLASVGARGEDPDSETARAFDRLADDLAHARAERERERTEKNREADSSQD